MDISFTKVFQPPWWSNVLLALMTLLLQVGISFIIADTKNYRSSDIIAFSLVEIFFIYLLFVILSMITEKITITHDEIVRTTIFGKQIFLLHSIRLTKLARKGRNTALLIQTDSSASKVGVGLTNNQIREAAAYILELIRIYYPENIELMKNDKEYEVEDFWHK